MDTSLIKDILNYWRGTYYLSVVAILCLSIALISGIRYYRKRKEGAFFLIYIFSWLIAFTLIRFITEYVYFVDKKNDLSIFIEETATVVISAIEYGCFSYFLYRLLTYPKSKILVKVFTALFIIPVFLYFQRLLTGYTAHAIRHLSFTLSSVEMFFLTIPSLLYFYELFQKNTTGNLSEKPSFWIISALLLYCIVVIPFFLVADKFITASRYVLNIGFAVHLTSFSLLFLALTKAFSLNKSLTE